MNEKEQEQFDKEFPLFHKDGSRYDLCRNKIKDYIDTHYISKERVENILHKYYVYMNEQGVYEDDPQYNYIIDVIRGDIATLTKDSEKWYEKN